MRLQDLVASAGLVAVTLGAGDPDVTTLTMDSRAVVAGALFACVVGAESDGHDHAAAAVAAGAAALVVERPVGLGVPEVVVADTRRALGPLADALAGHPSSRMRVVGVTGTNGKTTTVGLLAGIFSAHGWTTATIGTLTQARTTPEAPELQERLGSLADAGTQAVAMEVSSHALAQHRVDATRFAAGTFTNLTQDHLDYHGTMERYFEAKASLFAPGRVGVAVVNRDDPYGARLLARLGPAAVPYGDDDATAVELRPGGTRFRWRGGEVQVRLAGRFNLRNALAAATTAAALGVPTSDIAAGLASVEGVPGRFQRIDAGQRFTVVVDYAHTPDGLDAALSAAREVATGRVIVVFGAGGDRDRDKRPQMGAVAARLADAAIVTSDNPRHEDPSAIIEAIVSGVGGSSHVSVEPDRRAAIRDAVAIAAPGDVVLIAGKGHEQGQDLGDRVEAFDDVTEAREAVARVLGSRRDLATGAG